MTRRVPTDLMRADLSDLIGPSKAVRIVSAPKGVPRETLEVACLEVRAALCPFPALSLAEWFWSSLAGQSLARAEWLLYGEEAMFSLDVQRAFFGKPNKRPAQIVAALFRKGSLKAYGLPVTVVAAHHTRGAIYARRSEVIALWEIRKAEGKSLTGYPKEERYTLREVFPERESARRHHREARRRQMLGFRTNPTRYKRCASGGACKSHFKTRPYLRANGQNFVPSTTTDDGWSKLCTACIHYRKEHCEK